MIGDIDEARKVPVIESRLMDQLQSVAVSAVDHGLEYRACQVQLKDGTWQDRVYVVEALPYVSIWGVWPWEDRAKQYVPIDHVVAIDRSPTALPPAIVRKIYDAGESGMGYCVFTVVWRDGERTACEAGNAVDWIELPPGRATDEIVDVSPHEGRQELSEGGHVARGARYAWCLFRVLEP